MKNNTIRHLVVFIVISLSSGWIGVSLDRQLQSLGEGETPGMGLWLILPFLTAVTLTLSSKSDWKNIGLLPNLRGNLGWYGCAVIIFPAVSCVVIFFGKVMGWTAVSTFDGQAYLAGFATALLPGFIKNIFEECVWRGYLSSKLITANLKDYWIYLIVGGVWGLWHVPYYLYFLPESAMVQVLAVDRITFALVALLTMVCWSVMYVELYRITKSIWPVVILHMMEDAMINHLVIDKHILIQSGKALFISPIVGGITSAIYLLIGLRLRKARLSQQIMHLSHA